MRGLKKSKRVSWASEVNLCQVRLFLSEDSPSLVGLGGQDDLQAKASWPSYSSAAGGIHDDNLPPGFEGTPPASLLKNKLSQIPLIKWSLPPVFIFNPDWKIVAGEESKEVDIQNQREMRVLEAVYPRPSAIPPNPAVLPGIENSPYNDEHTPLIPITPIEDEDAIAEEDDSPTNMPLSNTSQSHHHQISPPQCGVSTNNNTISSSSASSSQGMPIALEPEVLTAAYAALSTVLTSSSDQANLIDPELLVQILSNPGFIESLATTTQQAVTNPSSSPGVTLSDPPVHINRNDVVATMSPPVQSGPQHAPFYPPPNRVGPSAPPPLPPPAATRDINYYKSLIQQHGEERNDSTAQPPFGARHGHQVGVNPEASVSNHHQPPPPPPPRARDAKPKINKPCIYFNSSRGCRHGANCAYQHDVSAQQRGMQDVQNTKRMKVEREITGT